jgi:ADP-heptose:LPS heptosyltransferase
MLRPAGSLMKILLISLAGIGDTLMATPLIHELRLNFPDAVINAFVMWPGARDVLEGNPHLNAVIQRNILREGVLASLKFTGELRTHGYDLSLNTHPQSRIEYRVVAWRIGARRRLSHRYDNAGPWDRALVHGWVEQDYSLHASENNLALLPLAGASRRLGKHSYELTLSAAERDWAEAFVRKHGLAGRRVLGVHVGSGRTKNLELRRWPLDRFAELFRCLLQQRRDLAIVLFGGPEEREDHAQLLALVGGDRVVAAETPGLRHTAAVLRRCGVFLSVDTVLMHLAAAMEVPRQIVIETPTFNKTVEPFNRPFVVVPNPLVAGRNLSYYRYDGRGIRGTRAHLEACMRSVTVEAVCGAVERALSECSPAVTC